MSKSYVLNFLHAGYNVNFHFSSSDIITSNKIIDECPEDPKLIAVSDGKEVYAINLNQITYITFSIDNFNDSLSWMNLTQLMLATLLGLFLLVSHKFHKYL